MILAHSNPSAHWLLKVRFAMNFDLFRSSNINQPWPSSCWLVWVSAEGVEAVLNARRSAILNDRRSRATTSAGQLRY